MRAILRKLVKSLVKRTLHVVALPFPPRAPRVLVYHSVDDVDSPISISTTLFRRQMEWLRRRGYTTWTASRFARALHDRTPLPRKTVVITFDDGYRNNVTRALPILEANGQCATVFMVTQNDGDLPRWPARDAAQIRAMVDVMHPGSAAEKQAAFEATLATLGERLATWDELKDAPRRGLELQSHTRTHPYMNRIPDEQLRNELAGSRQDLEAQGFGTCTTLAWPYGAHDDRAIECARQAGYTATFLGDYFWERRGHQDPLRIHRISVDPTQGLFGLKFMLGSGLDLWAWLKRGKQRRQHEPV